jgi:Lipase (class 3)
MLAIPTDVELVDYAAGTYNPAAVPFIEDLFAAIRIFLFERADGLLVISPEGTHSDVGWALDFFAIKAEDHGTKDHPGLGFIHAGFYIAALRVFQKLVAELEKRGQPFALSGHSLGAALALLLGGMFIQMGLKPVKIGAFAPPRVGGEQFVSIVSTVPIYACRYGMDPVPLAPMSIPSARYRQVPIVEFDAPFTPLIFDNHHYPNYVRAVHALVP